MNKRPSKGGVPAHTGPNYQNRVAAWLAAHILAEQDASLPWALPESATLASIHCETDEPVDDLLARTSLGGRILIQAKRALSLGTTPQSHLGETIDQFVRQFTSGKAGGDPPLHAQRDRLVLATSSRSSGPITTTMVDLLDSVRALTPSRPLDDAVRNEEDARVLGVLRQHIARSWRQHTHGVPEEADVKALLGLIWVWTLDVDEGGRDETHAREVLRWSVLQAPEQAGTAWAVLAQRAGLLAGLQAGTDRQGLVRELLRNGIRPRAPRSYHQDIERLVEYSGQVAKLLQRYSVIAAGSRTVKVVREQARSLYAAAIDGSLLLVGEPGAGKSGAIHTLFETLRGDGRDVVLLAAGHPDVETAGQLRADIGLSHDMADVLAHWPGAEPGFLLFDGLDAARSESAASTLKNLLSLVMESGSRWRVVASVREYDLRYSPGIRGLFLGGAIAGEALDAQFPGVRHLYLRLLAEFEIAQVAVQWPELASLVASATLPLRRLLQNVFNLRLAGELLAAGTQVADLGRIETQVQLLDRYWENRVLTSQQRSDEREELLRRTVGRMVESRSLQCARHDVQPSSALGDLLSAGIIQEWQARSDGPPERSVLLFAHHVLFDYAVARLLLRGAPGGQCPLVALLRVPTNRDLVLAIRPSIVFHLRHEWARDPDRGSFWRLVLMLVAADGPPRIAQFVGPSVAVDLFARISDCSVLLDALGSADESTCEAAQRTLRYLLVAAIAAGEEATPLAGPVAAPWCEFVYHCALRLERAFAYWIQGFLWHVTGSPELLTPAQRDYVGRSGRLLVDYAWKQTPQDPGLIGRALRSVCRTFASDPVASAELIRVFLRPDRLADLGYRYLLWIVSELPYLMAADPDLVGEVYDKAFAHEEVSEEPVYLGGPILSFRSTRRQDYESDLYQLAEVYPQFLNASPEEATRALIRVLVHYSSRRHAVPSEEAVVGTFPFRGVVARIREDYSHRWERWYHNDHEPAIRMLNAFREYLGRLGGPGDVPVRHAIVGVVAAENQLAVVWSCLLQAGATTPKAWGSDILPLASAVPVLMCSDVTATVGEFIAAVFPTLGSGDRETIERAILSLADSGASAGKRWRDVQRRLLERLPTDLLVTDEARMARGSLDHIGDPVSDKPWPPSVVWSEDDAGEMAEVGGTDNGRVGALLAELRRFVNENQNRRPTAAAVADILPSLVSLHALLLAADPGGLEPTERDDAWGYLAHAAARATRTDNRCCHEVVGTDVRDILLEAAKCEAPRFDAEQDKQFAEFPSWSIPATRVDAAQGLLVLASCPCCVGEAVLDAIAGLSQDAVAAVRFHVAQRCVCLAQTSAALMWAILNRMCEQEPNAGVILGVLDCLARLAGAYPERVSILTKAIYDRMEDGPGTQAVRTGCVQLFTGLHVHRDEPLSRQVVYGIADRPGDFSEEAADTLLALRRPLTLEDVALPEQGVDDAHSRARMLFGRIIGALRPALEALVSRAEASRSVPLPTEDMDALQRVAQLAQTAVDQVYFASGAYGWEQTRKQDPQAVRDLQQVRRFYREVAPFFDDLTTLAGYTARVGNASPLHRLLEMSAFLLTVHPEQIILRVSQMVREGIAAGYQYESLAEGVMVAIVERFLAEHRDVLRGSMACRNALVDVLDTFVDAGSMKAVQLVYRLDEVYR